MIDCGLFRIQNLCLLNIDIKMRRVFIAKSKHLPKRSMNSKTIDIHALLDNCSRNNKGYFCKLEQNSLLQTKTI